MKFWPSNFFGGKFFTCTSTVFSTKGFHLYKYGVLNLHYMVIYENRLENRRLFGAHLVHHPTLGCYSQRTPNWKVWVLEEWFFSQFSPQNESTPIWATNELFLSYRATINLLSILNHSKWSRIEKDLPKCLVIGRWWLVLGRFTLEKIESKFWLKMLVKRSPF